MQDGPLRNNVDPVTGNRGRAVDDQRIPTRIAGRPQQGDRVMAGDVAHRGTADGLNAHDAVGHRGVDGADVRTRTIPEREQIGKRETLDSLGEVLGGDFDAHALSVRPAFRKADVRLLTHHERATYWSGNDGQRRAAHCDHVA